MAKTIVGLFDDSREAQRAVVELIDGGIAREDIGVTSSDYTTGAAADDTGDRGDSFGDKISGFFGSLFGDDDDARHYTESVQRGGVVVTVDAETDADAERAVAVLNRFGGDVDTHGTAQHTATAATTTTTTGYEGGATNASTELREGDDVALPVIEEELAVGKREVERGGVRVRSRIIERPVEEAVRLREERVSVERRPVNRPVTDEDIRLFREGTFEVTERAEVPVVAKQTRVVEEVSVNKEVGERTETITDTVRRTDVEVEEVDTNVETGVKTPKAKGAKGSRN